MLFWNSLAFSMIQQMLAILVSGSSAFSKTSLNIRKFMVHILLKPGLQNFALPPSFLLGTQQLLLIWRYLFRLWKHYYFFTYFSSFSLFLFPGTDRWQLFYISFSSSFTSSLTHLHLSYYIVPSPRRVSLHFLLSFMWNFENWE